jgi:hypothetical protein
MRRDTRRQPTANAVAARDINPKLCLAAWVGRGEADGARQVQTTAFIAGH